MQPTRNQRLDIMRQMAHNIEVEPIGFAGFSCHWALPALELERMGEEAPFRWDLIEHSLQMFYERVDCQDFASIALLRMLYRYPDSKLLTPERRQSILDALLQTKYEELDPGPDKVCWFTENHQALWASSEYLVGQLLPDEIFSVTGKLGCWHRERARERVIRWLDWRIRFGFSEWNANGYCGMDLILAINLAEFAEDTGIRNKANVVANLLLFDLAANSWRCMTAFTQGRAYEDQTKDPLGTGMALFAHLLWGEPKPGASVIFLCASDFDVPEAISAVGRDLDRPLEIRERQSLDTEIGPTYGVFPDRIRDLDFWFGAGIDDHPDVVETKHAARGGVGRWKDYWYARDYYRTCRKEGKPFDPDPLPVASTTVNIYTYKTPDYVLSCAQDYRAGKPGFQQLIWCAAIGPNAVIYSNNPVNPEETPHGRPSWWMGNGINPRVLQHKNVLIAMHRIRPYPMLDRPSWPHENRAHAWIPKDKLDEVIERNGRLFLRCGTGYLAMLSTHPAAWREENEWNIENTDAAFICELGSEAESGSFDAFVAALSQASIEGDINSIRYDSPTLGSITTGWELPLEVAGRKIATSNYPRFDTPWCHAEFGSTQFEIACNGEVLTLGREANMSSPKGGL
jgi:hypothetical protein